MEKIERMDWTAGLAFEAYGLQIGVRVSDPQALNLLAKHLPYSWRPTRGARVERLYSLVVATTRRRQNVLYGGAEQLARSTKIADVLEALERDAQMYVAEFARRRVFVHAAAVGWKGRAIVIPGKSMSGKTSLAAAFVRAGATYYSDEYTVFDDHGRVHPYAKPLSIRSIGEGYRQTDYPVASFGGRAGTRPIPVGIVLVTQYREGSQWRPRSVSAGMGAMALLANTLAARTRPEKTMDVLQKALGTASVVRSLRGEASEVVESVLSFNNPDASLRRTFISENSSEHSISSRT